MALNLLAIVGILLGSLFVGTPVSFSLGFTAVMSMLLFLSPDQLQIVGGIAYRQCSNMNQLVAPLFILMAEFLARGNVAADIFRVLQKRMVRFKGGLAISATLACTVFAALCGSSPATAAAIGRISIQEMINHGYRPDFAVGTVVAGGTLGIMIPPSITFVTYGIITENSIAKLFMSGVLPGLMISALLCLFIILRVRLNPSLVEQPVPTRAGEQAAAQPGAGSALKEGLKAGTRVAARPAGGIIDDLKLLVPSAILIVAVLGSLYTGLATATEAAGVGAVGAMLLVIALGRLNRKLMTQVLLSTARTSTMILFMVIGGMTLSYVVSFFGLPQAIASAILGLKVNKWVVLFSLYFIWFVLGCLMDPGSMIVLTMPFVYRTLILLGFDPIWLGAIAVLWVEIGMITPPVGLNLFVIQSVTDVPSDRIIAGSMPFVIVLVVAALILTAFPGIALYLPSRM